MTPRYNSNDPYTDAQGVLINKLGLAAEIQLQEKETELLVATADHLFASIPDNHRFGEQDILMIHRQWLGALFKWAGKYRSVDISSEDIRWCHAPFIASEMQKIHKKLQAWTPFSPSMIRPALIEKLACIHGDLILIHPFRDGNGRTIRLLGDLLLMQSGREPISNRLTDEHFRTLYYAAIHTLWVSGNYSQLESVFNNLIPD